MFHRPFPTLLACSALLPFAAPASDLDEHLQLAAAAGLEPVVVTATRTRNPDLSDGLSAVSVVTREDIEAGQFRTVAEVLRGLPGVSLTNTGGPGKATSLFLRGTNSDHVRVLVDGVRIGSATTGQAAFENLPVGQIERIEIVRGPQSGLYGADAVGGVIQIFTRRGDGAPRSFFEVGGGSYGTFETAAGVSGGGERGWYSLSADFFDTRGFDARTLFEPDDDGYRQLAVSARGGLRLGQAGEIELSALRSEGENEFDGNPDFDAVNESDSVLEVLGASWRYTIGDALDLRLSAARSEDRADNFRNGDFRTRFNTQRDELQGQIDWRLAGQQLSLGVDWIDDQVEGTTQYDETSRYNTGVFAQWLGRFGPLDLRLAGRHDDNQRFGSEQTGSVGLGWRLTEALRARVSYGTAFKAPSFNELYFPGFGNPEVQPEEAHAWEAGIDWTAGIWQFAAGAFRTGIDDLIVNALGEDGMLRPENVDKARVEGVELSGQLALGDWELATAYTYQRPRNRGNGQNAGNRLPRRPDQLASVALDRRAGRVSGGISAYWEGRRFDDAGNNIGMGSYALVDLRAAWEIDAAWSLHLRLANALDRDYQTVPTYHQPGRAVYATLRYRM